jgi:hypothetical protein
MLISKSMLGSQSINRFALSILPQPHFGLATPEGVAFHARKLKGCWMLTALKD